MTTKVLTDLKQFTYETVLQTHFSEKTANSCSNAAINCIVLNFKSRGMYIPSEYTAKKLEIRNAIREEFNGNNHVELALKYKRSLQSIYKILKTKNKEVIKRAIAIEVIEDYIPAEFIDIGLTEVDAKLLAKEIAKYLIHTFPGISIYAGSFCNLQ